MDDETKAAFAEMMARMNDGFERVLNEISTLKTDFQNTKGFLLEDSIVTSRRTLTIEDRLSALERKIQ
nr:hypothetical protein [uncultured Rhodopila sp.]